MEQHRFWVNIWPHGVGGGTYPTEALAIEAGGRWAVDCVEIVLDVVDRRVQAVRLGRDAITEAEYRAELVQKTADQVQQSTPAKAPARCSVCGSAPSLPCAVDGCPLYVVHGFPRVCDEQHPPWPMPGNAADRCVPRYDPKQSLGLPAGLPLSTGFTETGPAEPIAASVDEARRNAKLIADTRRQTMRELAQPIARTLDEAVKPAWGAMMLTGSDLAIVHEIVRDFLKAE